jgi:hypothetical protein
VKTLNGAFEFEPGYCRGCGACRSTTVPWSVNAAAAVHPQTTWVPINTTAAVVPSWSGITYINNVGGRL